MPRLCDLPDEVILLTLNTGLLSQADIAAVAVSCRRLKYVAEGELYTRNRDRHGSSAVRWAAEHGNIATLDKALKHRLVIDETDLSWTLEPGPLQTAVLHRQDAAVAWLLDHGADVTRKVSLHCTCSIAQILLPPQKRELSTTLHMAICLGHVSTAQLLISRGAPLEYSTYVAGREVHRTNALFEASLSGLDTVVETLVKDHGMIMQRDRDALVCAALYNKNVSTVRTLVGLGADVNGLHGEWSSSPLHTAIDRGNFAVAKTLLDLGAKIHSHEYDTHGDFIDEGEEYAQQMGSPTIQKDVAPLHDTIASDGPSEWDHQSSTKRASLKSWRAEQVSFMKRLIKLGADVNKELVGNWGVNLPDRCSPLDLATAIGNTQDMAMLITAGAEVKSIMLLLALDRSDVDMPEKTAKIRLLLQHGARLDQPIMYGVSMLKLAASSARALQATSGLHELLLSSSSKNLSRDHLNQVLAESLLNQHWYASTVLVRHGARVPCQDKLFSIASRIAENLKCETQVDELQAFDKPPRTRSEFGPHDCFGSIIGMGLSTEDQCLIFQDFLRKRLINLVHLFLDRGLTSTPEAAVYLPAYLVLAASWGNICVIERLWQDAHEAPDEILIYSLVQLSIIAGNREAVSFFMEHGATPSQCLTRAQASSQRQMRKDALVVYLAAPDRLEASTEINSASSGLLRESRRARLLTERYPVDGSVGTYLRHSLSPLQLAVKHGDVDIIGDLLDHVTESQADAITTCGKIYIPCILRRANEIREMVQKKGVGCW